MNARYAFLPLFLVVAGCGQNPNDYGAPVPPGNPPPGLGTTPYYVSSTMTQTQLGYQTPVDFLAAVDGSEAMDNFIPALESSVRAFLAHLASVQANFQLSFISAAPNPSPNNETWPYPLLTGADTQAGDHAVADIEAIRAYPASGALRPVQELLDMALNPAGATFRPGSHRVLFVLSTADETPYSKPKNSDFLQGFLDAFGVHQPWWLFAVGSPSNNPCPTAESQGQPLLEALVAASHGSIGRVCDADSSPTLNAAEDAAAALLQEFALPQVYGLIEPSTLSVKVGGQVIPSSDYSWDPTNNGVIFAPANVPAQGQTVEVDFDYVVL